MKPNDQSPTPKSPARHSLIPNPMLVLKYPVMSFVDTALTNPVRKALAIAQTKNQSMIKTAQQATRKGLYVGFMPTFRSTLLSRLCAFGVADLILPRQSSQTTLSHIMTAGTCAALTETAVTTWDLTKSRNQFIGHAPSIEHIKKGAIAGAAPCLFKNFLHYNVVFYAMTRQDDPVQTGLYTAFAALAVQPISIPLDAAMTQKMVTPNQPLPPHTFNIFTLSIARQAAFRLPLYAMSYAIAGYLNKLFQKEDRPESLREQPKAVPSKERHNLLALTHLKGHHPLFDSKPQSTPVLPPRDEFMPPPPT